MTACETRTGCPRPARRSPRRPPGRCSGEWSDRFFADRRWTGSASRTAPGGPAPSAATVRSGRSHSGRCRRPIAFEAPRYPCAAFAPKAEGVHLPMEHHRHVHGRSIRVPLPAETASLWPGSLRLNECGLAAGKPHTAGSIVRTIPDRYGVITSFTGLRKGSTFFWTSIGRVGSCRAAHSMSS